MILTKTDSCSGLKKHFKIVFYFIFSEIGEVLSRSERSTIQSLKPQRKKICLSTWSNFTYSRRIVEVCLTEYGIPTSESDKTLLAIQLYSTPRK